MENKKHFIKDNIWLLSIILLSTILILLLSTKKINYHVDELLTYSLANSTSYLNVTPGETYVDYGKHQESFFTTNEETKFNYQNVWIQQANDVHPPFYYVIIHTISSFMPGVFSKYIGLAVNILFNALIIFLLFKFAHYLTNNKKIAYVTSLFWAVNPGILSDMMFIRMYIMMMFFCLLISYVHIKYLDKNLELGFRFYVSIFLVSLAGALTHYYFIVFNFFISALFVLLLLYWKKLKPLAYYVITYVLTFSAVYTLFPHIYNHILGDGNRGEESRENFFNLDGYVESIQYFWKVVSNNLFGGFLILFVIFIIGSFLAHFILRNQNKKPEVNLRLKYVFLLTGITFFFLLISKIAVYGAERYLQPIFPILILLFVLLLYKSTKVFLSENTSIAVVTILLFLICINGYVNTTSFEYLKQDSKKAIEVAEQYSDKATFVLYDKIWKLPTNYVELSNYESVTLYNLNDIEDFYKNTKNDEMVLYIHTNDEAVIQTIVNELPNINTYKKLNEYGYCTVYYLY